jgi:hypothetical protein
MHVLYRTSCIVLILVICLVSSTNGNCSVCAESGVTISVDLDQENLWEQKDNLDTSLSNLCDISFSHYSKEHNEVS